jgi:hypothetical protein
MNRQELKELFGTATELAHECLALYQATTPENRERAMRLFETETQLIRLWLIRLARTHLRGPPSAEPRRCPDRSSGSVPAF